MLSSFVFLPNKDTQGRYEKGRRNGSNTAVNAIQDGTWCEIKTSCCVFIAGQKEVGWSSKSLSAENGPSLFRVTQRDT